MNFGNRDVGTLVLIVYGVIALIAIALGIVLYILPWLIARHREHKDTTVIGLLTVFLGWTTLGWIAALVWAFTDPGVPDRPRSRYEPTDRWPR